MSDTDPLAAAREREAEARRAENRAWRRFADARRAGTYLQAVKARSVWFACYQEHKTAIQARREVERDGR